jgi:hypothetical protein
MYPVPVFKILFPRQVVNSLEMRRSWLADFLKIATPL